MAYLLNDIIIVLSTTKIEHSRVGGQGKEMDLLDKYAYQTDPFILFSTLDSVPSQGTKDLSLLAVTAAGNGTLSMCYFFSPKG